MSRTFGRVFAAPATARFPTWSLGLPALIGAATLALYAWGLDRSGWANQYYSAAVLAGTRSWKAFFFGSLDAGNFITVDKPPASLWLMELSARLFGVSSWSILLPEALLGSASAVVLYFTVKRVFGPLAAAIAAGVSALTPVAVLMFRYNNPDALLTLLMVVAAWALTRALEDGRWRWLLVSAAAVGLGFNTKYLQAYLVLPALVLTYFVLGPHGWGKRFVQLLGAGAVLVVSSAWWMTVVDAIPAASRPYIGGSTSNSVLDLAFGYDGLSRVLGQGFRAGAAAVARGSGGIVRGPGGFGGQPGVLRLFNQQTGGQVSWLIPLAIAGLAAGLWLSRAAPRREAARAGFVLWGLWFFVTAAVFSFAQGIFHGYYTVTLAPAIGALVGAGLPALWRLRSESWAGAALLSAAVAATGWLGYLLLTRTPDFAPGLATVELGLALAAAVVLLLTRVRIPRHRLTSGVAPGALAVGVGAIMLGPAAYDLQTVATAHASGDPMAGPSVRADFGGAGFGRLAAAPGGGPPAGGTPGETVGGPDESTSSALLAYLEANQGGATWLVAVSSANAAAPLELASGKPVLAMGGFSGSDPAPTLAQLKALIKSGQLRFVMLGRGFGEGKASDQAQPDGPGNASGGPPGGPMAGNSNQAAIQAWVTSACKPVTTAGVSNLYDCSGAA